jgi:hypothetical protein
MMSYDNIDRSIEKWVTWHKIYLLHEECVPNRRYYYVSSQSGETFQVVIEPEREGKVRIDAHLIESLDDKYAHFTWEVSVSQIQSALDMSLATTHAWFQRAISGERE